MQSRGRMVATIAAPQLARCLDERARVRQLSARSREPQCAPLCERRAPQVRKRHMSGGCCVSAQTGVAVQGATSAGWRAWAALEPRWTTPGRPCKPRTTRHKSGPSAAQRQTLSLRNRAEGWVSLPLPRRSTSLNAWNGGDGGPPPPCVALRHCTQRWACVDGPKGRHPQSFSFVVHIGVRVRCDIEPCLHLRKRRQHFEAGTTRGPGEGHNIYGSYACAAAEFRWFALPVQAEGSLGGPAKSSAFFAGSYSSQQHGAMEFG